jgi:hypothetical protein
MGEHPGPHEPDVAPEPPPSESGDPYAALSGTVYGCIIYLAVLAVLSEERPPPTDGETAIVLLTTATVYWVAHVYAHIVPFLALGRPTHLRRSMVLELPVLAAVVVPLVPIALHAVGLFSDRLVFELATGSTLVVLFVTVLLLGRKGGRTWVSALTAGGAVLVSGLLVVALKAALH